MICGNDVWQKKSGLFDVAQGSFDGAEICTLIDFMILVKIREAFPEDNLGIYRDDGLGVTRKHGHNASTMEKKLHNIFKSFKLKITTQINMKTTHPCAQLIKILKMRHF